MLRGRGSSAGEIFDGRRIRGIAANDTLPDAAPVPEGVNVTVNCTCCPAGIVTGNDNPVTAKAEPITLSEDTITV